MKKTILILVVSRSTLRIFITLILFSGLSISCQNTTCINYVNKTFREKKFDFIVVKKYEDGRYWVIEGYGKDSCYEVFKESGFSDLFKVADLGDHLIKESGQVNVILEKKGNSINFPCYCNGEIVK